MAARRQSRCDDGSCATGGGLPLSCESARGARTAQGEMKGMEAEHHAWSLVRVSAEDSDTPGTVRESRVAHGRLASRRIWLALARRARSWQSLPPAGMASHALQESNRDATRRSLQTTTAGSPTRRPRFAPRGPHLREGLCFCPPDCATLAACEVHPGPLAPC